MGTGMSGGSPGDSRKRILFRVLTFNGGNVNPLPPGLLRNFWMARHSAEVHAVQISETVTTSQVNSKPVARFSVLIRFEGRRPSRASSGVPELADTF